jgi:hypothetical protein
MSDMSGIKHETCAEWFYQATRASIPLDVMLYYLSRMCDECRAGPIVNREAVEEEAGA